MAIPSAAPRLDRLGDPAPHARLLGSARYSVLVTGAGSGRSSAAGLALTRWSADPTQDAEGLFVYLRDLETGAFWSAGFQPSGAPAERYEVTARPGGVAIARESHGIETTLEIAVAPAADAELRRLAVRERSGRPRRIEVTTCAEVALDHPGAAAAHPAFSKLFVETGFDAERGLLLARRRPRAAGERFPWLAHALLGPGRLEGETDRARFLGRGGTLARPLAMLSRGPLSGVAGSVLDPVLALRRTLELPPHGEVELTLLLAVGSDARAACSRAERFAGSAAVGEALRAAEADERARLARLGLCPEQAAYLDGLAGAMLYGHPALRAPAGLQRVRGGAAEPGLGDERPLAVARVRARAQIEAARDLLLARSYWAEKGVDVDLLLLCESQSEELHATLRALAADGATLWRRDGVAPARLELALACAALVLDEGLPSLEALDPEPRPTRWRAAEARAERASETDERLQLENGFGGFSPDASEYVIRLAPDPALGVRRPPMPWTNVLANESFGCLVSESGAACTWSRNSREHRITPWTNDPVSDLHGEALYLRDEEAGVFWSPTPGPVPDGASYEARHGFGSTVFRHASAELAQEVSVFVARRDPVKLARIRLANAAARPRRISVFSYQRLVLGVLPERDGRGVVTAWDAPTRTLFARNARAGDFADGVVFAAAVAPEGAAHFATADRTAFLGRNASPALPRALREDAALELAAGAALDACAALQLRLEIPPGGEVECAFLLGEAGSEDAARALVARYRAPGAVETALAELRGFWVDLVSGLRVTTPVPALDLVLNGWLLYQTLSCRLWGRSAFYQSGGAFGFRDQLQDAAALLPVRPDLARAQILLHAAHQFEEGDVLHWWHPPASRGTRTRCSDDLLWLPYLTQAYVAATGDEAVLDVRVGFRTARALAPGEDEAYLETQPAQASAPLHEHCCRALDRSLATGAHGLPLMGTGDWNDGMNRVGREGRGESVWLGFFLFAMLADWAARCERRGEGERARRYREHRARLAAALRAGAWDGAWYRRAWYDDGSVLGSAASDECQIDALAQAWAVISGAAPPERAAAALDAVEKRLVSLEDGIVRLLAPAFDRTRHDPGYIKGYVPGIRENGGQYTHAALWFVRACAEGGRRERAAALLERLTPVWHAATPERAAVYQVEPYAVAADVYGVPPHVGRGGWTWYTGSAGWMLRVALESLLGFGLEGGSTLVLQPRIPDAWPGFTLAWRRPDGSGTRYEIAVRNPDARAECVRAATLDGVGAELRDGAARIPLVGDAGVHRVEVVLGAKRTR
jgi:cyclic beta-1,2-glucan synthetase